MYQITHLPRRAALATALVAIALATIPRTAEAGSYVVHTCRKPDGSAAPVGEWHVTTHNAEVNTSRNGCPSVALELQMRDDREHDANDYIRAGFAAPPDTDIEGYSVWRSARTQSDYNYRLYEKTSTGTDVPIDVCLSTCTLKGGVGHLSAANLVRAAGRTGVKELVFLLTCGLGDTSTSKCPATAPAARLWLYRGDITLRDASAPVFASPPTGPLVSSSAPLVGKQSVSVSATDKGSGVYQAQLEIDGSIAQTMTLDDNGGQCRPPFTASVPCKLSASATVNLDTTRLADGAHALRILVSDATGTNVAAWGPGTFTTANRPCNPEPSVDALTLQAGVLRGRGRGRRLRGVVTTGFGRRVRVRGRLVTPQGEPVPGAEVCVAARTDLARASLRVSGSVVTDADGRFSYMVPAGPSRRIFFIHRTPDGAVSGSVMRRVRASATFRASDRSLRTGQAILFSGRLRGKPVPRRGVLVEIQARRPTGWQTFGTARADRRGRFRFRYLFSRTRGVQHYSLRARVPRQATYPFLTGTSGTVRVRVRG